MLIPTLMPRTVHCHYVFERAATLCRNASERSNPLTTACNTDAHQRVASDQAGSKEGRLFVLLFVMIGVYGPSLDLPGVSLPRSARRLSIGKYKPIAKAGLG
jgi:hypothetical protein